MTISTSQRALFLLRSPPSDEPKELPSPFDIACVVDAFLASSEHGDERDYYTTGMRIHSFFEDQVTANDGSHLAAFLDSPVGESFAQTVFKNITAPRSCHFLLSSCCLAGLLVYLPGFSNEEFLVELLAIVESPFHNCPPDAAFGDSVRFQAIISLWKYLCAAADPCPTVGRFPRLLPVFAHTTVAPTALDFCRALVMRKDLLDETDFVHACSAAMSATLSPLSMDEGAKLLRALCYARREVFAACVLPDNALDVMFEKLFVARDFPAHATLLYLLGELGSVGDDRLALVSFTFLNQNEFSLNVQQLRVPFAKMVLQLLCTDASGCDFLWLFSTNGTFLLLNDWLDNEDFAVKQKAAEAITSGFSQISDSFAIELIRKGFVSRLAVIYQGMKMSKLTESAETVERILDLVQRMAAGEKKEIFEEINRSGLVQEMIDADAASGDSFDKDTVARALTIWTSLSEELG
jgi:hypothetical protein